MKRYCGITFILVCCFCGLTAFPQIVPSYTIPSYNIQVTRFANFTETLNPANSNQAKEKRQVDVQVKSTLVKESSDIRVWVYTLDRSTILGPYVVKGDGSLKVDVDQNMWGVFIDSRDVIYVDVWIVNDVVLGASENN